MGQRIPGQIAFVATATGSVLLSFLLVLIALLDQRPGVMTRHIAARVGAVGVAFLVMLIAASLTNRRNRPRRMRTGIITAVVVAIVSTVAMLKIMT